MTPRFVQDVRGLPNHAFGRDSILWWGTLGFVAIEGFAFVLAAATYFYLMREVSSWPPGNIPPPGLLYSTLLTAVLLLTAVPAVWAKSAALKLELRGSVIWLSVCFAMGCAALVLRGLEFTALGIRWDSNAYGSILWTILGLHTLHIGTDLAETAVVIAVLLRGHVEPRRFTDVAENVDYWYFVLIAWVPLYVILYLVPRMG